MERTIAIDFGTTKTLVSYWDEKKNSSQLVKLGQFINQIPSSIFIAQDRRVHIGEEADQLMFQDYARYCRGFKMKLGEDGQCIRNIKVNDVIRNFTAEELTVLYLKEIKRRCEEQVFHGDKIKKAIITVPVAFDEMRRRSLINAAKDAGLEVSLLDEPIAAGRAYLEISHGNPYKSILVVDWGGGTLDISLVKNEEGIITCSKRHTFGSCETGGEVLDKRMFDLIVERCNLKLPPPLRLQESVYQQENMRKFKEMLATDGNRISVTFTPNSQQLHGQTYKCSLTINDFETKIDSDLNSVGVIIKQACDTLKKNGASFDFVLLIGGSSQIPAFVRCVSEATGMDAMPWEHSRQAVALGAAYHIHSLEVGGAENESLAENLSVGNGFKKQSMLSQTNMLSEKQKTESETKPFKVIPSWADDNWNGFASN